MRTRPRQLARIPTGFRNKAQGCDSSRRSQAKAEERATLGKTCLDRTNPERVVPLPLASQVRTSPATTLSGLRPRRDWTQGSSFLATLGWRAQSLRDWLRLGSGFSGVCSRSAVFRCGDSRESQRDSATKPRVARNELPWEKRALMVPTLK